MSELPNREDLESQFAKRFGKLARRHLREFRRLLGDPPDLSNVPPEFWDKMQRETDAELYAILLLIFDESAIYHGWDTAESGLAAYGWAKQRAEDFSKYWVESTQTRLANGFDKLTTPEPVRETTVAEARAAAGMGGTGSRNRTTGGDEDEPFEPVNRILPGQQPVKIPSKQEIDELLKDTFGENRIETNVIDETTRARHAGGEAAIEETVGISQDDRWRNNPQDSKSGPCPICTKLNGLRRADWPWRYREGPPSPHPRCCCTVDHALVPLSDAIGRMLDDPDYKSLKAFNEAESRDEGGKWTSGGSTASGKVNLEKIHDPRVVNRVHQTLSDLHDRFGLKLDSVEAKHLDENIFGNAESAHMLTLQSGREKNGKRVWENSHHLTLNSDHWQDGESFNKKRHELPDGYLADSSATGMIRHEYAHALEKEHPEDAAKIQEIYRQYKPTGGTVSGYSIHSSKEMVAEGFAHWMQQGSLAGTGLDALEPIFRSWEKNEHTAKGIGSYSSRTQIADRIATGDRASKDSAEAGDGMSNYASRQMENARDISRGSSIGESIWNRDGEREGTGLTPRFNLKSWYRVIPNAAEWRAYCRENELDVNNRLAFKSWSMKSHDVSGESRDDRGRWTVSGSRVITPNGEKHSFHNSPEDAQQIADYENNRIDSKPLIAESNRLLRELGHPPVASFDKHGNPTIHPDEIRDAIHQANEANELLKDHPNVPKAKVSVVDDMPSSSHDPAQIKESLEELKKINSILAKHGQQKIGLSHDADFGGVFPDVTDGNTAEDVTELDRESAKLNKRLESYGLNPKVHIKLTKSDGSHEIGLSHDPDELSEALDMLRDFKNKKSLLPEWIVKELEPFGFRSHSIS